MKQFLDTLQKRFEKFKKTTFLGRLFTNVTEHGTGDQAAMLAYYLFCSFVPFIVGAVSILGLLGVLNEIEHVLMPALEHLLPRQSLSIVDEFWQTQSASINYGLIALVAALPLLWSATQYLTAFGRASDRVYGFENSTPGSLHALRMLVLLLLLLLLSAALALAYIATSSILLELLMYLEIPETSIMLISLLRYPLLLLLAVISISLLYKAAPSDFSFFSKPEQKLSPRKVLPGALVATVLLIAAVWVFTHVVLLFSDYDARYGALAGVMMLILLFWLVNTMLLLGLEVNKLLDELREEKNSKCKASKELGDATS